MRVTAGGDCTRLLAAEAPQGPAAGLWGLLGRAPFASLVGAALGGSGSSGAAAPPPVTERRTGTCFAGELEYCAGKRGCPIIAGAGARTKRIAGIKSLDIYAVGLYVDQGAAHSALHRTFGGAASAAALATDQRLFDELMASDSVEKTLRIVITSGLVKRKAFLEALEERLEPPLKQAGETAALQAFTEQFSGAQFRKGLEITFTTRGAQLQTRVDGEQVGSISNRALAQSLLDIYLGADPVSKGAKESFGAGLAAMVLA